MSPVLPTLGKTPAHCLPARPTTHTGHPPMRRCWSGEQPTASLETLPGSELSFPAEEDELGVFVISASSSGRRGAPFPRSMVLALLAKEVKLGLAWGLVPLGRKPEMGLTVLRGQGRPVLGVYQFYRQGSPGSRPQAGPPSATVTKGCFRGLLGLPGTQGSLGTQ